MADPMPRPDDLLALLRRTPRRQRTQLVGIDGGGGSGKSTLARGLEQATDDVTVVEFDDFYLPLAERQARVSRGDTEIGGDFDWRRVRDQVLMPLSHDESAKYQRYDWPSDAPAEWHSVVIGGIVVVEGNYSTRRELFGFYDYTLWIDAPRDLRLERGVRRGGEDTRDRWLDEWMPEEDRYIAAEAPATRVDRVLDGSGRPPAAIAVPPTG
jgi:uridine kinase